MEARAARVIVIKSCSALFGSPIPQGLADLKIPCPIIIDRSTPTRTHTSVGCRRPWALFKKGGSEHEGKAGRERWRGNDLGFVRGHETTYHTGGATTISPFPFYFLKGFFPVAQVLTFLSFLHYNGFPLG